MLDESDGNYTMNHYCVFCLYDLPLFKGFDPDAFGQVCLQAAKLRVAKGQYAFRQGESAKTVYLVKTGTFKLVHITGDGRDVIVDVIGPGEVIGETALFQEQMHPFSAVALELSRICCFSRSQFEAMIEANPNVAMQVIGFLARRLYESIQQSGETSGASVRQKVLQLMARLAEKHGRPTPDAIAIELDITQQEIADMIGASRVMVANILKQLHDEGLVRRRDRYYLLNTPGQAMTQKEHFNERNPEDDSCPAYHSREFLGAEGQ
jgi:CRP/FNR family transcriptional regulator